MAKIITISLGDWFYDMFIKDVNYKNRSRYLEGLIAKGALIDEQEISMWNKEKLKYIEEIRNLNDEINKLNAKIGRIEKKVPKKYVPDEIDLKIKAIKNSGILGDV